MSDQRCPHSRCTALNDGRSLIIHSSRKLRRRSPTVRNLTVLRSGGLTPRTRFVLTRCLLLSECRTPPTMQAPGFMPPSFLPSSSLPCVQAPSLPPSLLAPLCSGQLAQWDTFLTQVEGFTTLVPMITSPGNHEVRLLRTVPPSERKLAAANLLLQTGVVGWSFLDSCPMAIRDSN